MYISQNLMTGGGERMWNGMFCYNSVQRRSPSGLNDEVAKSPVNGLFGTRFVSP